jgi:hypothetical protein
MLQERPGGGLDDTVSDTVPLKPLTLEIVSVEDPVMPWEMVTLLGVAVIVKSGPGAVTVNAITTVCAMLPLVPTTVTVYAPMVRPRQERVTTPLPRRTIGVVREHSRPVDGVGVTDRLTVPVKPLTGVNVSRALPLMPERMVTDD